MQDNTEQTEQTKPTTDDAYSENVYFVNQLYRDFLLPTILGEDNASILYWAGKCLARHYDLASLEDLSDFFNHAQFGHIELIKQRRASASFELTGQTVLDRMNSGSAEFALEAGMIAETLQRESGRTTECELEVLDKEQKVQFTARF